MVLFTLSLYPFFNHQFLVRILLKYYMDWSSVDDYAELMKLYKTTENAVPSRFNIRHPIPMVIGIDTDASIDRDCFTIEKLSHLQNTMVEVVSFNGYRSGHSVVQVGQHLYILGGKDADGITLKRVSDRSSVLCVCSTIFNMVIDCRTGSTCAHP